MIFCLRQFASLLLQERHLGRRLDRAARWQSRIGVDRGGGGVRTRYLTRRWLACYAAISALLDAPGPGQVAMVRATLSGRPRPGSRPRGEGSGIEAPHGL